MKKREPDRILYKCDPEKNKDCAKQGCNYNPDAEYLVCSLTTEAKYSADGVKYKYVVDTSGTEVTFRLVRA